MSIFGMGLPELAVIGVIAVVVFGPKKLPELGSSIGKALRSFKQEMNKATEPEVKTPESVETALADKESEKESAEKEGAEKESEKEGIDPNHQEA